MEELKCLLLKQQYLHSSLTENRWKKDHQENTDKVEKPESHTLQQGLTKSLY